MGKLNGWQHCPRCAAGLEHGEGRADCPKCGSSYYANAAATASALVLDVDGRLLLARRAFAPDLGSWDTIGGFLEEDEHPNDALLREVAEETALEVEPGRYVGTYLDRYGDGRDAVTTLNLVFEVQLVRGTPTPADDVAELEWFSLEELPPANEFAFNNVGPFVHEWAAARVTQPHNPSTA